jgi:ribosomal protein S18 acetylase RimI-like enzyme
MNIDAEVRLPDGYQLRLGSLKDRALLVRVIKWTYRELFPPQKTFSHLAHTVDQYLSSETPLWWVVTTSEPQKTVACLWMGNAIDQVSGDRYFHIFLLYVAPEHRRRGIAKILLAQAHLWAKNRGDRQIGLQVFLNNQLALNLYQNLGYQTQSLMMIKHLI